MTDMANELVYDDNGLLPAVVQSSKDKRVLMLGYMNRESLHKTVETGWVHFWSRSRKKLWKKGETSGNVMKVVRIQPDCDKDCLLIEAEPEGPVCHTGEESCFFSTLFQSEGGKAVEPSLTEMLEALRSVIRDRKEKRPSGSYTTRLFEGGVDRITKKLGEEAVEVVIAAKNQDNEELTRESADLLYHLLVLWEQMGLAPSAVARELQRRRTH
jgi:phosphoribosyl-ATP pyrophosphohydrolase/phosphoribosyl-AMP cyclohydrolase